MKILQKKIDILEAHLPELKKNYKVKHIGVFGSYATGEETTESDIDVLVEFSEPIGFFQFIRLENHLSELLGVRVDLVTKGALKPAIKDSVLEYTVYV